MTNVRNYLTIAIVAISLLANVVLAAETGTKKKIRILGVGNSYTVNSTKYLTDIINSDPDVDADVAVAYRGGCPLNLHVTAAKAHEANPDDPKGKIYNYIMNRRTIKRNISLKEMLQDGKWDYITIQQVSTKSYKPESFYPFAKDLYDYIKKYCPDAKVVIHETWSHRIDCPRTKTIHPDEMYKKLHANYAKISKELNAPVIPVGTSFQNAKKRPMWDYQPQKGFDPKTHMYPDKLPDQSKSLHNGYNWHTDKKDKSKKTVSMDGSHAGQAGEYLAGCVWYQFFFNKDPRKLTYKPKGLSEEQAKSLREIAYETINQEQASADK